MSDDNPAADHIIEGDGTEKPKVEENLKSRSTWLRLVFMVVFYALASLATIVLSVVVVLGFLWVLITGDTNSNLKALGQGIAAYLYQIVRYLSYNSEEKPFPFEADWPSSSD